VNVRAYIITTGVVFALITVAHIARLATEPMHVLREPVFLTLTVLAAALSIWAFVVLRRVNN
jgi:hypothetical protein